MINKFDFFFPETFKYWVGVQQGQSYLKWKSSCENCKIFTNSFFYGTPPVAAFCQFDKVTVQ